MKRVLFVSNGHGETAIAARLALELQSRGPMLCDHLALVGDFRYPSTMREVGPRAAMPSGGVIAMGNVRNIAQDLRAGLVPHTIAQLRFLRGVRGSYAAVIAVGDIFALIMSLQARADRCVYVGTAKSVYVAAYGTFEERVLRKAGAVFVRDAATAARLQQHGIAARAANVIADLYPGNGEDPHFSADPLFALFPGSREPVYDDAPFLAQIVRRIAAVLPRAGAVLSLAPGIDDGRLIHLFSAQGWRVAARTDAQIPFSLYEGDRELIRAWRGSLESLIARADLVLGQAGTANEAAAARGVPIVAFAAEDTSRRPWYRKRQIALLGDAVLMAPRALETGAQVVIDLLADEERRRHMGAVGRQRMGPAGAAALIAQNVLELVNAQ